MTVLSIVAAGSIASFFLGLTEPFRISPGLGASLVYGAAVSALVGGVALRFILPLLTGVEISYPWAVAALGIGNLVATAFTTIVWSATRRHTPSAAPVIWSSPLMMLATAGVGFVVSYWVISIGGHTRASRSAPRPPARPEPPVVERASDLGSNLVRTQNVVTNACIDISRASATDIPGRVVDALTEISVCANSLRAATIPDQPTGAVVANLVAGLDHFSEALTTIASDAAASGSDRLPQRGLLFGSLADVSDGGSRARYELDHAEGLAEIRTAFETLRGLGYLREEE